MNFARISFRQVDGPAKLSPDGFRLIRQEGTSMYALQLDSTHRDYLLSLLQEQRTPEASGLVVQLRNSEDVFGMVMWSNDDIASQLREQGVPDSPENVWAVRESYIGRHIDDQMVEHGWGVLKESVCELKRRR
jgi:hypothetical protein